uniref:Uncharacterized protein n=1 Tax=Trypanosoma vivax (strain Y486) TaxID=1055687 RepID=G0TVU8_TRYVY|nr:conserved hypothetical protein [Trypanosoma vivax Y486]
MCITTTSIRGSKPLLDFFCSLPAHTLSMLLLFCGQALDKKKKRNTFIPLIPTPPPACCSSFTGVVAPLSHLWLSCIVIHLHHLVCLFFPFPHFCFTCFLVPSRLSLRTLCSSASLLHTTTMLTLLITLLISYPSPCACTCVRACMVVGIRATLKGGKRTFVHFCTGWQSGLKSTGISQRI